VQTLHEKITNADQQIAENQAKYAETDVMVQAATTGEAEVKAKQTVLSEKLIGANKAVAVSQERLNELHVCSSGTF